MSVVAIDAKNSKLSSKTPIQKISQYHSFKFHMVMWRYFVIGLGKRWNYTGLKFQLAFPLTYDLSGFKSRINRYLLTVGSF